MKPLPPDYQQRLEAAFAALYGPPMTDDERREHERLIARQKARDEAARRDSPQMELDP